MDGPVPSAAVAEALGQTVWRLYRAGGFLAYLEETHGRRFVIPPEFDSLYVAEAESGDIEQAVLRDMIQWWEIDDVGFRPSSRPGYLKDPDNPVHVRSGFYRTPFLRFYLLRQDLVFGETYGPALISRKRAHVSVREGQVAVAAIQVAWKSS